MKISFICIFVFILFVFFIPASIISQEQAIKDIENLAKKNWINQNYKLAAEQYEKLLQLAPSNTDYAYKFAVSNFLAGFNIEKSLKYIEPLIKLNNSYEDITFWIGKMYKANYQFNDAIDMFNTYLSKINPNSKQATETKRHIDMCLSAIQLLNNPVNVHFENVGTNINSSANEFLPLIPSTEEFIIFTSDKHFDESAKMFDENLYISYQDKNSWTLAKPLSYINTYDPEKGVGLSNDGKILYVCGHFGKSYSDINVAIQKNKKFKFDPLNNIFNTLGNKLTTGASITEDGKTIYFSAVRNDSYGKSDIYVIKTLPNGQWSLPKKLGEVINTQEDEMYPQISPDGKVLYFVSRGHNSMGGFDIFVSHLNEITGEWTTPQNLGYPINSPNDEHFIAISPSKRYAYISTVRKEGFGGSDIYKITFNTVDAPVTVIKGTLFLKQQNDSSLWKSNLGIPEITIYDKNKNIFGKYLYNFALNRFVAALPSGEYLLSIKCTGYKEYTETLNILDRSLYVSEIEKTFSLTK